MKVRIYNDILNPAIWDNNKLNPEIKEKLLQIGKDFYADTETDAPLKDILFVGSLANYNWSDTSDFDVHVVIDFKDVDGNVELVEKLVNALKSKWNDEHDIHLKGHNVEVYIQDVTKENRSTGVYSLMQDKIPPVRLRWLGDAYQVYRPSVSTFCWVVYLKCLILY